MPNVKRVPVRQMEGIRLKRPSVVDSSQLFNGHAKLHVAGALDLFENHLVHAAAGVDEGGGEYGQTAAFFRLAGSAKETLRLLHGVGVQTAGQELAAGWRFGVVGPGQTRDRIEQDD